MIIFTCYKIYYREECKNNNNAFILRVHLTKKDSGTHYNMAFNQHFAQQETRETKIIILVAKWILAVGIACTCTQLENKSGMHNFPIQQKR